MTQFIYEPVDNAVYVVMVNDRHTDPDPLAVFTLEDQAVQFAHDLWIDAVRDFSQLREDEVYERFYAEAPDDWSYSGVYTEEGDSIWVVRREVR